MSRRDNEERTGMRFISVLLSVLILIILAGYLIFKHYYNMLGTASGKKPESGLSISIPEEMPDIDELADKYEEPEPEPEDSGFAYTGYDAPLFDQTDIYNVMLVGVDTRENEFAGRSDAMILISFSKETGRIVMTSFLRDIYVDIPDNGHNRLNAAHVFGGTDLLKETILKNFGIKIDNTIVVNFYLVKDFVDAVGGIDAELISVGFLGVSRMAVAQRPEIGAVALECKSLSVAEDILNSRFEGQVGADTIVGAIGDTCIGGKAVLMLPFFGGANGQTGFIEFSFEDVIIVALGEESQLNRAVLSEFIVGGKVGKESVGLIDLGVVGEG